MYFRNEYWFLSNFYPCKVTLLNGLTFENAEAAFQSYKVLSLEDKKRFCNLSGAEAKKLGRNIKLRPDWNEIRLKAMYSVLMAKFKNKDLAEKLLNTPQYIEETNTWNDTFWGVCNGIGENKLGKCLMLVRDKISR